MPLPPHLLLSARLRARAASVTLTDNPCIGRDTRFSLLKSLEKWRETLRRGGRGRGVDRSIFGNACILQELKELQHLVAELRHELHGVKDKEKHARKLAYHDDLTNLTNRRFFRDRLGQALRADHPELAVVYIDLDGFKALNDAYGHAVGDHLLTLVAARLVHSLRAEDVVSRLGGDEFACLLFGVSNGERLLEITDTLHSAVAAPFVSDSYARPLTVRPSIGIAVSPHDGLTVESLMNAADSAMYAAKRARKSIRQSIAT